MVHEITQAHVPRLRGVLHAATFPLAIVAGGVLVAGAPTGPARAAAVVYAVTSVLLFGVSAAYHRAHASPLARNMLHRFDHANIYLIIAGTCTPFAVLGLHGDVRLAVLAAIWAGAVAGAMFRVAGCAALALHLAVHRPGLDRRIRLAAPSARRRSGGDGPGPGRRELLQPGRCGLRVAPARPMARVVRIPRGVPRAHRRRLHRPVRGDLARRLPGRLTAKDHDAAKSKCLRQGRSEQGTPR